MPDTNGRMVSGEAPQEWRHDSQEVSRAIDVLEDLIRMKQVVGSDPSFMEELAKKTGMAA